MNCPCVTRLWKDVNIKTLTNISTQTLSRLWEKFSQNYVANVYRKLIGEILKGNYGDRVTQTKGQVLILFIFELFYFRGHFKKAFSYCASLHMKTSYITGRFSNYYICINYYRSILSTKLNYYTSNRLSWS